MDSDSRSTSGGPSTYIIVYRMSYFLNLIYQFTVAKCTTNMYIILVETAKNCNINMYGNDVTNRKFCGYFRTNHEHWMWTSLGCSTVDGHARVVRQQNHDERLLHHFRSVHAPVFSSGLQPERESPGESPSVPSGTFTCIPIWLVAYSY